MDNWLERQQPKSHKFERLLNMMKRRLKAALEKTVGEAVIISLAFSIMTTSLIAVTGKVQAKAKSKYGIVDIQAVILNVKEGKEARALLEKEIKAKEKELLKQKAELDKMNKDWKSQAALLSESARLKKQQDFQEKFLSLRNAELAFQTSIKRKEQKATQKIALKVAKFVEKLARERGFEAVFETNSAGLLFLKDPVNLTNEIISSYENATKNVSQKSPNTAKKGK